MTSETTEGSLARGHRVALRRQLAVGLEAAIRDGHIAPGARLPSTRDLARRLGLHRETVAAAFARLRKRGFARAGAGRRPRVFELEERWSIPDRHQMFIPPDGDLASLALTEALQKAFDWGIPREPFLARIQTRAGELASSDGPTPAAYLFEPRPGLRAALTVEIEAQSGVRVIPVARLTRSLRGRPVLLRREILRRVRRADRWECIPLSVAGGTRERGLVRRRVRFGLVVLISVSRTVRQYAEELAARDFERGVSFVALDPRDGGAVVRATAAAKLIFFDRAAAAAVPPGTAQRRPIQLIPRPEIVALRNYLGLSGSGRLPAVIPRSGT